MTSTEAGLAEMRAAWDAWDAWDRMGQENTLLPSEWFNNELAGTEDYYDETSHWPTPEPRRTGAESRALTDVVNGSCRGWAEPPTAAELYNAFRTEEPSDRELALLRTWFMEATME